MKGMDAGNSGVLLKHERDGRRKQWRVTAFYHSSKHWDRGFDHHVRCGCKAASMFVLSCVRVEALQCSDSLSQRPARCL
jgi:hypothetical protein